MNKGQLELDFKLEATKSKKTSNQDKQYLEEFKEGNFTNLLKQTSFTQEEIFTILLNSPKVSKELKKSLFIQLLKNLNHLKHRTNDELIDVIRQHNNQVRQSLRRSYENADKKELSEKGLLKFYKYNNKYFEAFGGRSLKMTEKEKKEFEQYKRNQDMSIKKEYVDSLLAINDKKEMYEYRQIFLDKIGEEQFRQTIYNIIDLSFEQKNILLSGLNKKDNLNK